MTWTVTRSNDTIYITPDGTSNWDLQSALEVAIGNGYSSVARTGLGYIYLCDDIIQVNGIQGDTHFLYFSGITLLTANRFILEQYARVRCSIKNSAGNIQARPSLVIQRNTINFFDGDGILSLRSNSRLEADGLDFSFRQPNGFGNGSLIDAGWTPSASVSITNSTITSDVQAPKEGIFYLPAGNSVFYGDETKLVGLTLEIVYFSVIKGIHAVSCVSTKATAPGKFFRPGGNARDGIFVLDDWRFEDCTHDFTLQFESEVHWIDCEIDPAKITSDSVGGFGFLQNSIQLDGGTGFANGNFYLQDSNTLSNYKQIFNSLGIIAGGNENGLSTTQNSSRIVVDVRRLTLPNTSASDFDRTGAWNGVAVKYGKNPVASSFALNGTKSTKQIIPFAAVPDTDITQSNASTVAAYTTIAVDHPNQLVTVGSAATEPKLYDWLALEKSSLADSGVTTNGLAIPKCALPTFGGKIYDRGTGDFIYNLRITSTAFTTGGRTLYMGANKVVTFATAANYSNVLIDIPANGRIHFEDGGTATLAVICATGAQITVAPGQSVTVALPTTEISKVSAGTGVTISAPLFQITGIPDALYSPVLRVKRVSTGAVSSATIANNAASLSLLPEEDYELRLGAWNHESSKFVIVNLNLQSYKFDLTKYVDTNGDDLYPQGSQAQVSNTAFDAGTLQLRLESDGETPIFTVLDGVRILGYLLTNITALGMTALPYYRNGEIYFPKDSVTGAANPVRIYASDNSTVDPKIDFPVNYEGFDRPDDLFPVNHTNYRIVRYVTTVIASPPLSIYTAGGFPIKAQPRPTYSSN
jgi:hypothetical protein